MAKKKTPNLIHVDEFLAIKEVRPEVAAGFKVYMKGRSYQYGMDNFEKEFENYFNRKI